MKQQPSLAFSVGNLLALVSTQSIDHLAKVDTDLSQTSLLITEAIDKLAASFMAIHAATMAQQVIIDETLREASTHEITRLKLDALRIEIGIHVNAAITSLQFQDMTSQLLDRSRHRIQGLHETLGKLDTKATQIAEKNSENSETALVAQLDQIRESVSSHSNKLDGALRKAVNQTHLESGDIELF